MQGLENTLKNLDWEKQPGLTYTPDPEEVKKFLLGVPFDAEGVFDFNAGLSETATPLPPPPPHCDQRENIKKAASDGDLGTLQRIFDQLRGTPAGDYWLPRTYLAGAVENSHRDVVEYLLSQGSSPNVALAQIATRKNDKAMLELFLQHGWDINEPSGWRGPTTLAYALEHADLVTWFLLHGADPNGRGYIDETPLSIAVRDASFDIVKTLFAHGGSAQRGQLPHYAANRKLPDRVEVMAYLVDKGAAINDIMYQHDVPSTDLEFLCGLGTPLHSAAMQGSLDLVQFLVENGADLNIVDSRGKTVVQIAEYHRRQDVVDFIRRTQAASPDKDVNLSGYNNRAYVLYKYEKDKSARWLNSRPASLET